MASIATLLSNVRALQKLLGLLSKGGLPDDFFQRVIDDRKLRQSFVTWAKAQYETEEAQPEVKLWERISDTAIRVFLSAPPKVPFDGAEVEWNDGTGSVTVENRDGPLYVDGVLVDLHLTEAQKTGTEKGHSVRKALKGLSTLHPNIMDALFENVHLIPENWKVDEEGRTRYIYFWAVGYCNSDGSLYVRCLFWRGGVWNRYCNRFDHGWHVQDPAAVLE